jgi:hypothetical protein
MNLLRAIALPLLLALLAVSASAVSVWEAKRSASLKSSALLALAAVVATGIAGVSTAGSKWASEKEKDEIIAAKHEELVQKAEELKQLQMHVAKEQKDLLTGGDNYIYLRPELVQDRNLLRGWFINESSSLTLYGVKITLFCLDALPLIKKQEDLHTAYATLAVAELPPKKGISVGDQPILDTGLRLIITVEARNGTVTQLLKVARVHGEWRKAFAVRRFNAEPAENKLLIEEVDPDFPRKPNGDWW